MHYFTTLFSSPSPSPKKKRKQRRQQQQFDSPQFRPSVNHHQEEQLGNFNHDIIESPNKQRLVFDSVQRQREFYSTSLYLKHQPETCISMSFSGIINEIEVNKTEQSEHHSDDQSKRANDQPDPLDSHFTRKESSIFRKFPSISSIVQQQKADAQKLYHAFMCVLIIIANALIAYLPFHQQSKPFGIQKLRFVVVISITTVGAILLLSLGQIFKFLLFWILIMLIGVLIVAVYFFSAHFIQSPNEEKDYGYQDQRFWFTLFFINLFWIAMFVFRVIVRNLYSLQVAIFGVLVFSCDIFPYFLLIYPLQASHTLVAHYFEPIGAFILGFYVWTMMHLMSFGSICKFQRNRGGDKNIITFSRVWIKNDTIFFLISATLIGAAFVIFSVIKNKVKHLTATEIGHLDPKTMGLHLFLEIISLRIIINNTCAKKGGQITSLIYTIILATLCIVIFDVYCSQFDQNLNPYNILYIQKYSLAVTWSAYILILSFYNYSKFVLEIFTVLTFLFLNVTEGIIYPQRDLMDDYVFDYVVWITRGIIIQIHVTGFVMFLVKQKSGKFESIIQAFGLIMYVWSCSLISGELISETKSISQEKSGEQYRYVFVLYSLSLLLSCFPIIWNFSLSQSKQLRKFKIIQNLALDTKVNKEILSAFQERRTKFRNISLVAFIVLGFVIPVLLLVFYWFLQFYSKFMDKVTVLQQIKENEQQGVLYSAIIFVVFTIFGVYINEHVRMMLKTKSVGKLDDIRGRWFIFTFQVLVTGPLIFALPYILKIEKIPFEQFYQWIPVYIFSVVVVILLLTFYYYTERSDEETKKQAIDEEIKSQLLQLLKQSYQYIDYNFIERIFSKSLNEQNNHPSNFYDISLYQRDNEGDEEGKKLRILILKDQQVKQQIVQQEDIRTDQKVNKKRRKYLAKNSIAINKQRLIKNKKLVNNQEEDIQDKKDQNNEDKEEGGNEQNLKPIVEEQNSKDDEIKENSYQAQQDLLNNNGRILKSQHRLQELNPQNQNLDSNEYKQSINLNPINVELQPVEQNTTEQIHRTINQYLRNRSSEQRKVINFIFSKQSDFKLNEIDKNKNQKPSYTQNCNFIHRQKRSITFRELEMEADPFMNNFAILHDNDEGEQEEEKLKEQLEYWKRFKGNKVGLIVACEYLYQAIQNRNHMSKKLCKSLDECLTSLAWSHQMVLEQMLSILYQFHQNELIGQREDEEEQGKQQQQQEEEQKYQSSQNQIKIKKAKLGISQNNFSYIWTILQRKRLVSKKNLNNQTMRQGFQSANPAPEDNKNQNQKMLADQKQENQKEKDNQLQEEDKKSIISEKENQKSFDQQLDDSKRLKQNFEEQNGTVQNNPQLNGHSLNENEHQLNNENQLNGNGLNGHIEQQKAQIIQQQNNQNQILTKQLFITKAMDQFTQMKKQHKITEQNGMKSFLKQLMNRADNNIQQYIYLRVLLKVQQNLLTLWLKDNPPKNQSIICRKILLCTQGKIQKKANIHLDRYAGLDINAQKQQKVQEMRQLSEVTLNLQQFYPIFSKDLVVQGKIERVSPDCQVITPQRIQDVKNNIRNKKERIDNMKQIKCLTALEVVLIIVEYALLLPINLKTQFIQHSYSDYNFTSIRKIATYSLLAIDHFDSSHYWMISAGVGGSIIMLFFLLIIGKCMKRNHKKRCQIVTLVYGLLLLKLGFAITIYHIFIIFNKSQSKILQLAGGDDTENSITSLYIVLRAVGNFAFLFLLMILITFPYSTIYKQVKRKLSFQMIVVLISFYAKIVDAALTINYSGNEKAEVFKQMSSAILYLLVFVYVLVKIVAKSIKKINSWYLLFNLCMAIVKIFVMLKATSIAYEITLLRDQITYLIVLSVFGATSVIGLILICVCRE